MHHPRVTFVPVHPFADWPDQGFDPRFGFSWYCEPAAFVTQSVVENGTLEAVTALNDLIDRVLADRAEEVCSSGGLLLFHDWRSLKGYERAARKRQLERMRARKSGYARRTVVVVAPANRLLRMAVETTGLFATVTFGARVELVTHPDAVFGRSGIRPPGRRSVQPPRPGT
jgi:hypothetical protein